MTRNFASDFTKELDARFSKDATGMSYSEWVCKNTTLKGVPFNFKRYPFQKAIMDDMHPNLCVIKPSQQGATELQMRKALAFLARNRGTTLMFTFPSEPMLRKQAQTRFQPLIEADRVLVWELLSLLGRLKLTKLALPSSSWLLPPRPPRQVSPVMPSLMTRLTYQTNRYQLYSSPVSKAVPTGSPNNLVPLLLEATALTLPTPYPTNGSI